MFKPAKIIVIALTLVTLTQFLGSLSPIFTEASNSIQAKSAEISSQKQQQDKQDQAAKNDKRYRELEFDNSVKNCANPIGYEEDDSKKEANTRYFWVPKNKDVPPNLTRSSNPEYFAKVICSYTSAVNYKDNIDGKFKAIDNNLKELSGQDPASKDYKFTNSGNDFEIYFSQNPNNGFWFKNDKAEIKVTKVSISGQKLNFNSKDTVKLDGSTITYSEVLPSIDLQYKVDNEGVSKSFILKDSQALKNDLSKIEFVIDSGDKKLIKTNDSNTRINAETDKKLAALGGKQLNQKTKENLEINANDIQVAIDAQKTLKSELDRDLNSASKEIKDVTSDLLSGDGKRMENAAKLDNTKKLLLEKQLQKDQDSKSIQDKNQQFENLKSKLQAGNIDIKNKQKVKDEVDKITESSNVNDRIEVIANNKLNTSFKFETPYTLEPKSGAIKADTFKISEDGKLLTIFPDTSYLQAKERQFPIIIDPRLIGGNYTAQDTFYNAAAPTSARGSNNAFHILVGGNPCINVGTSTCAWMGDSRSAITFNIPNEVLSAGNVVWANFRLRQYSSNGGAFTARIKNACTFNETTVTWNTQPCLAADYGSMAVGTTNCWTAGCGGDRWSSDIGQLLRDNLNGGGRQIHVVLHDDNESVNRGAAFCSKDGWNGAHPCNNGTNQGPYLQIYLNERPPSPNADLPDNGDFIGKCDKSVTPNTGNCASTLGVDYKISNIRDGDGDLDCNLASVRIVNKSNFSHSWSDFWGPQQRGCPPGDYIRTYNIPTLNGRYDWAAINRDEHGLESSNWSNTRKFSVDTQPPVRISNPLIPEFSRGDKLNINANNYGDNLLTKYTINSVANDKNTNYISLVGTSNTVVVGQNGANLELVTPTNNSAQKWYLNGFQLQLESSNRTLCLNASPVAGSPVNLLNCVVATNSSQDWILKNSTQLALRANPNLCLATLNGDIKVGARLIVSNCITNQFNQQFEILKLTDISRRVDVNNGGANSTTNIHLFEPHDGLNQSWAFESTGKIRGVMGKCLNLTATTEGARVNYWDCTADTDLNQRWEYTDKKELKNVGANRCLDISGGNGNSNSVIIVINTCNDSFNQKWNVTQVPESKLYAKLKGDDNGLGDIFYLKIYGTKDLTGACITAGCNIHLWTHSATPNGNQRLIYTKNQEIKPFENQNVCADAASLSNGGNVYWFTCHGGANQKWEFDNKNNVIRSTGNKAFCIENSSPSNINLLKNDGNNIVVNSCPIGVQGNQNQNFRIEFENTKLLKNDLDYPNQQLQYNAQILKTNNPQTDNDYYFGDIKNSFQSNSTIQFPNGNQTGSLPEGDVWVRTRSRDRNQDGNANISEFTNPVKTTIDNSRPSLNNFGITGSRVISTNNPAVPLTIKFDVTEKNFRNAQLNVITDFSVLDYQNSYNDNNGNYGEATRVISNDGGLITQMLWNNAIYQAKTLNNKIYARTYRVNAGFDDWKEIDSQTNENLATNPVTKRLVSTQNSVSMTVYQNKLWQFIRGFNTGSNTIDTNSLYYRNTSDGLNWGAWTRLDAGISDEPAVISFNNRLLIYVRGTDNQLYHNSFNGTSFSGWAVNGQYTVTKPTAVIFNNRVYQTFQTNNAGNILNRDSVDGLNWSAVRNNGGQTSGEITMTVFEGKLVQTLRSYSTTASNPTNICNRYTTSTDGQVWSGWTCDNKLTTQTISLQKYGNKLYSSSFANDGKIYIKSTSDGITWTELSVLNAQNSTEVVSMGPKVIDVIDQCLNSSNQLANCNYLNIGSDINNQTLTFNYTPPANLAEGKYELKPVIFDRTCTGRIFTDNTNLNPNSTDQKNQLDTVDNCNLTLGEGLENFIRIDNSSAKIGISSPFDGAWVSDNKFKIQGGLGGFNQNGKEDKDISKFLICKATNTTTNCINDTDNNQDKTSTLNSLKNFTFETALNEGANYYRFKTVDSIGNPNTKVGNENSNSTKDFWTINYENTPPVFDKIEMLGCVNLPNPSTVCVNNPANIVSNDGVINASNYVSQNVVFRFKDNGTDLTKISGFDAFLNNTKDSYDIDPATRTKTNPKNFNLSLIRDIDGTGFKEIALFRDGINITNSNDDPKLVGNLNCTPESAALNSFINCNTTLSNLRLDGNYKLFIKLIDRAGNPICNTQYDELDSQNSCKLNSSQNIQVAKDDNNQNIRPDINIKTKTYFETISPKEAISSVYSNLEFKGKSEKGNTITIANNQFNRAISFKNDLSSNQSLPQEFTVTNFGLPTQALTLISDKDIPENRVFSNPDFKLTIECGGNFVDHDNLNETKEIEFCQYTIKLNQAVNAASTPARDNLNNLVSKDQVGNSLSQSITVKVDINNINFSSVPDITAFSPNGDGKFDKITFTNAATIPDPNDNTKTIDFVGVTSYLAKITLAANPNQIVWQKNDDLVNAKIPKTFEFNGIYNSATIPDGEYIYSLSLTRNINTAPVAITTKNIPISIKRTIAGSVVINSPVSTTNFTTNRAVINVMGELPASSNNDEWKVDLCFKLVDSNNAVSPNCVFNSSVNGVKGTAAQSQGYLKPITIANPNPTTLTNFQVKFNLDTQALISSNKLKNDCSDLRIKDSDTTTNLAFWIEKGCNTTATTIWVKIPSLLTGNKQIFAAYGSGFETQNASKGSDVFEFFDDFDTLSNWTNTGATSSNSIANINSGQNIDKTFTGLPADFKVETRYQRPSFNRNRMYLTRAGLGSPLGHDYGDFDSVFWNGFSGTQLPTNTWLRMIWENTPNNYNWRFENEAGSSLFTRSSGAKQANLNRIVFSADSGNPVNQMRLDWLLIRKNATLEPTTTISNTETNLGANDFFSTIVTVPTETARYRLTATATSKTGLIINSDPAKFVPITVDLAKSFKNISLTSSLEGLNNQEELTNFINSNDPASFNINKLKSLNLNLNVSSGTEVVAIDFARYTNIYSKNTNDSVDYSSIFRSDGRVALINNTQEATGKFNPNSDPSIKKNLYSNLNIIDSSLIKDTANYGQILKQTNVNLASPCTADSCTWNYNMVYPYWLSGGIYELRLRAFKGDSFEEQTVAFEINGQTNTTPKLLRTDKKVLTDRCEFATKLLATNPTNPSAIGLTGASLTFAQNCDKLIIPNPNYDGNQGVSANNQPTIPNPDNTEDKIKTVNSANYTGATGYRYATANGVKTLVKETTGVSNNTATGLTGSLSVVNADQYNSATHISEVIYTNSNDLKLYLAAEPNKLINFRLKTVNTNVALTNQIDGKVDPLQPTIDVCKAQLNSNIPNPLCKLYNQLNYDLSRANCVVPQGSSGTSPDCTSPFETKDTGILEKTLTLPTTANGAEDRYVLTTWSCTKEPALLAGGAANPKAGQCTSETAATKYTHYKIHVDKKTPLLDWVKTSVDNKSNPNAINPWIRSGDTVNVTLKTDEHLGISTPAATSNLITQAGYKANINKVIDTNITSPSGSSVPCTGQACPPQTDMGDSPLGTTTTATSSTPKLCSQAYSAEQLINQTNVDPRCIVAYNTSTTSSASFTPLTDVEGTYYFHLQLSDLAGNSIIYSNDVSVDNGTTYDPNSINPIVTNTANANTTNSINTLDKYLAGLQEVAKVNIQSPLNSTNIQDIDRTVLATKSKIDTTFLTDPTKKDASGNIITTGLSANQLLILNGVPITANNTGFGKDTNPIPANYPYTKVPVTNCIFDTNGVATNQPCQTDITGNITNASGSIRGQSRDFRLFVDNTNPDRIDAFQLTPDGNPATLQNSFCDQDGLRADGKTPERDRLSTVAQATSNLCSTNYDGTRFVVRGNQVTLKGSFEKNQRIALKVIKKNKLTPQVEDVKYYFPDSNSPLEGCPQGGVECSPAPVCQLSNPQITTDKTTKQSLITKFKDNCNYEFTYNIVDDGSQNSELDLNNYYDFSFYPIDKAGNTPIPGGVNNSISSSTLTVYHDLVKPNVATNTPECPQSSINCNSPITSINYNQPEKTTIGTTIANTWNQFDTTNQTQIEIKTIGERQSDLQQTQTQKLNQVVPSGEGCPTGGVCPLTNYGTENKIELTPNIPNPNYNNTLPTTTDPITGIITNPETISPNQNIRDDNNQIINDLSILKQTRILKMGDTGPYSENISSFNLGKATTDEADNCITVSNSPIKNRRVGTCANGDGLYTITERNIDTAGNRGVWVSRVIERDSVNPVTPTLVISAPGPKGDQLLAINVTNSEAYSRLIIDVYKNNTFFKNLEYDVNPNGEFNSPNLIGILSCPKVKYKVVIKTIDRAGNISQETQQEIETLECPSCMGGNQIGWQNPIQDARVRPTSGYRTTARSDHDGLDMNVGPGIDDIPIYPARPGTVTYARYSYTDAQRWTPDPNQPGKYLDTSNFVIIDHGDGFKTHYVHLMYEDTNSANRVTVGQQVTTNTVLGRLGNTGQSSGPHLHFGVFLNGIDKDPNIYINATGGDALDWQRPKWCKESGEGDVGKSIEDWANDNKTADEITINFNKKPWPLSGGDFKSIEGFNPSLNAITRLDEIQYGLNGNDSGGVYRVYGVAPYQGMKIKIKVWDGNNVVEEKEESLQNSKWIARKSQFGYGDTNVSSEQNNNNYDGGGRVSFDVKEKWSNDPAIGQDSKVTHQDKMWIDVKLFHETGCLGGNCKIPDAWTRWNNEKSSNRVTIENNLKRIPDEIATGSGIEEIFSVSGINSDKSKFTKADDANKRLLKFNAIGDTSKYGNVWILSHGWNGGLKTMSEIGQKIKADPATQNDTVLVIDWREASHSGGMPLDVCISSTWTKSVSEKVKEKLNSWGFTDPNKLKLVGHSMGTILNTEIGKRFGKAELSISLDPPSDPCREYNWEGYNITGTSVYSDGNFRSGLNAGSDLSRSFAGKNSTAGSQEHNRTANLSFQMDFNTITTNTSEHGWVQQTWRQMLDTDRLEGNTLGANDTSSHSTWERDGWGIVGWQGNHGRLFTNNTKWVSDGSEQGAGIVNRLEYMEFGNIRKKYKQ